MNNTNTNYNNIINEYVYKSGMDINILKTMGNNVQYIDFITNKMLNDIQQLRNRFGLYINNNLNVNDELNKFKNLIEENKKQNIENNNELKLNDISNNNNKIKIENEKWADIADREDELNKIKNINIMQLSNDNLNNNNNDKKNI